VPPGWGYLPTDISKAALAQRLAAEANAGGKAGPLVSASKAGGSLVSPMSAGSDCFGYTNIHIYPDHYMLGTNGNIGPTGGWYNLSSAWTNSISSYHNSDYYTSYFADYTGGGGATYGAIAHCWWNDDLAYATMSDGGTANDRFSSAWVGS
jgi:hypothetical protein